ncbi:hypothetical protein TNCV_3499581 [Trichonephila clavipes]|nr:hypothetical protein TNCV_3499581 [Trichonephila clavipes]
MGVSVSKGMTEMTPDPLIQYLYTGLAPGMRVSSCRVHNTSLCIVICLRVIGNLNSQLYISQVSRKDLIDELKIFGMSSRHHIDDFMRGRIIGKIEEGRKITDVAREFDIAHSVVSRM